MRRILFTIIIALLLEACAAHGPGRTLRLNDAFIAADTTWQGKIVIDGSVKVAKGARLTILPGTEVSFIRRDSDADGLGDGTLVVEGELVAIGSRAEPIVFRSAAADPHPGDWLEIRVDFSKNVHFRYCEFRDAAYTLHAHFTRGVVEDCTIHGNIDGCRLGEAQFVFRNNLFEQNQGKAINFRNATVEVTRNIIRRNGSGIFLFETDRESNIHHNNLYDNIDNLRLGDFFTGEVRLNGNWWGSADPVTIRAGIHDSRVDPAIGTVHIKPAQQWIERTGPRDDARLQEVWRFSTEGFVDTSVLSVDGKFIVCSWDGTMTALDASGRVVWSRALGDVVDATPATDGKTLYVQNWGRELFALAVADGRDRWRFSYAPSPSDDHRQGGVAVVDGLVLLPAWNGILYGLDAASGLRRWQVDAGMPLRSTPVVDGDRVYLASGSGRFLALGLDGELLWQAELDAPLLASPAVTPSGPVVVSRSGKLVAFDRGGKVRWRRDLAAACFYGSPYFHDGLLYVGTTAGTLWKLNADDGRTVWKQESLGPIYSAPILDGGRIVIGDNDGNLSLIGRDSATVIAQFRLDGAIQGVPLVVDGGYLIGGRDRNVYKLQPIDLPEAGKAVDRQQ